MSGQAITRLILNGVELNGERPRVLEDCLRGMRNVHGESMSAIIDSYTTVATAMADVEEARIRRLVNLRQTAREQIESLGEKYLPPGSSWRNNGAARSLGIQEFKWRDFINDKADMERQAIADIQGQIRDAEAGEHEEDTILNLQADLKRAQSSLKDTERRISVIKSYLDEVDNIVNEKGMAGAAKKKGLDGKRIANDVGTYIERRGRGVNRAEDQIFSENIRSKRYDPVRDVKKDDPFKDNKAVKGIKSKLGSDEYYIETIGIVPEAAIEELFREELKNEHNWVGYRESYDTAIVVVGLRDPRTGEILKNEDGTPRTRVILSSFDPHISDSQEEVVVVDGLVSDSNFVAMALNSEMERRSKQFAENVETKALPKIAEKQESLIVKKMRDAGMDVDRLRSIRTTVKKTSLSVKPPVWTTNKEGTNVIKEEGEIVMGFRTETIIDYNESGKEKA